MDNLLLPANAGLSFFMAGLIWVIQIVQYPMFADVPRETFTEFHDKYRVRITLVVVPAMLVELVIALILAVFPPTGTEFASRAALALLAAAWLSTFLLQVPIHERLGRGFDAGQIARLVATNWIRTAAWTGRAVIAFYMLTAF